MKKIKIFLLSLASSIGAIAADIDVTPGQLEGLLGSMEEETELKLTGRIDARDLAALENLSPGIKTLDMGGVSIEALTMPTRKYFGRTLFREGEIPPYTFFKSAVTALILPEGVTAIGEGAFGASELVEIVIPEGVTTLGDYTFYGCPGLKSVKLPSTIESIGKGAFGNCPELTAVDLSATRIAEVPERAFAGSLTLETVILPTTVKKVGREAFSHTAVKNLELSNVEEFEAYALSSMPFLESLAINPDAVVNDGLLMDDTSLNSLTGMPDRVPAYFAANCGNLDARNLETGATLGDYSFANTLVPEILVLPEYLTYVGRGALKGLDGLAAIDAVSLGARIPSVDADAFEGLEQEPVELWVADNYYDSWKSHPQWGLFNVMKSTETNVVEIPTEDTDAISISYGGRTITVEASSMVTDVRIYTSDGRMAYLASPDRARIDIETEALPSGVLIVTATNGEGRGKTISIINNR